MVKIFNLYFKLIEIKIFMSFKNHLLHYYEKPYNHLLLSILISFSSEKKSNHDQPIEKVIFD